MADQKTLQTALLVIILAALVWFGFDYYSGNNAPPAGSESEQSEDQTGNKAQKPSLIIVYSPLINSTVSSPLTVTGQAVGGWYFEATFPLKLVDANGNQVAQGFAQAQSDWMTPNFVPFTGVLQWSTQPTTATGTLILEKDNPSGE